jgi:predicted transcriptional regulator YheO
MTDEPTAAALLKTFNDHAEARAKKGDYSLLIVNARIGRLTKSQQRLVADILEKHTKRRERGNVIKTGDRRMEIGNHVLDLERNGMSTKAAVSHTTEDLKVSERAVWAALKFALGYYRSRRLVSRVSCKP